MYKRTMTLKWCMIVTVISVWTLSGLSQSSVHCPHKCRCTHGTVNTDSLQVACEGLRDLPHSLPDASSYRLLLANNELEVVTPRPYLSSTDHLDLSYNHIVNVSREAVVQLTHSIRYLYLTGNRLKCLPVTSHDKLHVNEITLMYNPWNCDCLTKVLSVIHSQDKTKALNCQQDNNTYQLNQTEILKSHFTATGSKQLLSGIHKSLMDREGFLAFIAAIISIAAIATIMSLMYLYRSTNKQQTLAERHKEPKLTV